MNAEGQITFEGIHETSKGKHIPVEVNAHSFELDGQELVLLIVRDISDKEKAKTKIKKAQQKWKNIFQAIGHPVIILDPEHNILDVNQATIEITGKTKKELLHKKCYQIFHNDNKPPDNCPIQRLLNTNKVETFEMEIEALGGYYLVSGTPVFDQEGNLERIIHIATDITQRKRAEQRYKNLVNHANDAIYIINEEKKFEFVNPAFMQITGFTAEDIYNADFTFWDIIHPNDIARIKNLEKGSKEEQKASDLYDFKIISKEGASKTVEIRTVYIDSKNDKQMGILRDISDRKNIREALRLQNQKYQRLIENEITGIGISDFDENLLFVNKTFADMLGYSVEELQGKNFSDLAPAQEYRKFLAEDEIRKKNHSSVYETQLIRKDGSKVDLIVNATPHKNVAGDIIGTVGVLIDITEKKRAEKAIKEREKWFKNLTDTISSSVIIYRNDEIVYVNQTTEEITGYSEKELLNMKYWEIAHPDFQYELKNLPFITGGRLILYLFTSRPGNSIQAVILKK